MALVLKIVSMFFAALRSSLSWLIKHPVVAHWLRSLVTKTPVCLSLIQGKVPDRLPFLITSIANQRYLILVHHIHLKVYMQLLQQLSLVSRHVLPLYKEEKAPDRITIITFLLLALFFNSLTILSVGFCLLINESKLSFFTFLWQ